MVKPQDGSHNFCSDSSLTSEQTACSNEPAGQRYKDAYALGGSSEKTRVGPPCISVVLPRDL